MVLSHLTVSSFIFITVHFRHKEVMLYPDDEKKPPVGCGLNRRAQVTLDRVWPMDKTTHNPITDPERLKQMDYEGKLRRVCAKLQTRFLEYRPQTGSWVFKVSTLFVGIYLKWYICFVRHMPQYLMKKAYIQCGVCVHVHTRIFISVFVVPWRCAVNFPLLFACIH
jgi:hypothetical protein